jgi:raffinose/stachyose/melibiose transport system substrate-binding protein
MRKSLTWMMVLVMSVSMVITFSLAGCKASEEAAEEVAEEAEEAVEEVAEEAEEAVEEVAEEAEEVVTITVTSWRTEDIEANAAINAIFEEKYPNIKVQFSPIKNTEYYAQLGTALETGTNTADIMSLHSYGTGLGIYEGGYLADLNEENVPGISEYGAQGAWTAEDGTIYGVPWTAVSAGIYYNKDIFDEYGLEEPELWSDFIDICDTLKENGETAIAQGSKDAWTLMDTSYSNYGANFYGGEESRQKLMAGEMKVTDEPFVRAFEVMDSLTQYYPEGYQAIDYVTMQQMFPTGQGAIYIGGSWEIALFKSMGMDSNLGWFPPPVENEGDTVQYQWNNGGGYGMYIDTPHPEEALTYLRWLLTPEYTQALMSNLPGFFGYVKGDYDLDPLSLKMMETSYEADLTERLSYEKISEQEPSGTTLFYEATQKLANGEFTPEEAAKHVQDGLETWYEPFQK